MHSNSTTRQILTKLMFRLLPLQVLIAAIGAFGTIVSNYFASNYIGVEAVSAIGVHFPVCMVATSTAAILVGGASMLGGKYMGRRKDIHINGG